MRGAPEQRIDVGAVSNRALVAWKVTPATQACLAYMTIDVPPGGLQAWAAEHPEEDVRRQLRDVLSARS